MSSAPEDNIVITNLSGLWNFPRYVYRVMDKPLSSPWNLRLIAWSLVLFPGAFILLAFTPIGVTSGQGLGLLPHFFFPGLVVWYLVAKMNQGAKWWEMAWSWIRLLWLQRKRATRVHPARVSSRAQVRSNW